MKEEKKRAPRNRTISLSLEEEENYFKKCLSEESLICGEHISDEIVSGDCFSILPLLPEKFVDLLIVDPPYNLEKKYGKSKFRKQDSSGYELFTRDWIEATIPKLKRNASIYVCCDWETSIIIANVISDYFTIRNRISWQREKGRGAKGNWKNSMEDIWFATLSGDYTFNVDSVKQRRKVLAPYKVDGIPKDWEDTKDGKYRDTYPSNFWDDISIPYWSMPENTDHPTQKPEKLIAKLILASSNEGDFILDPFAGAGTTCVTAKKLGRKYLGIEREPEYCALAKKRIEIADSDSSIQGYSDGVFWERNSLSEQKKTAKKRVKTIK